MPVERARRGRPKGSGLDDHAQLDAIRRMLAAKPGMKPTTAIRAAGISDPSTIRRLRDKLRNSNLSEDLSPAGHGRNPSRPQVVAMARPSSSRRAQARFCGFAACEPACSTVEVPKLGQVTAWLGVDLATLAASLEVQMRAFEGVLRGSAVKQHLEFHERSLASCIPRPAGLKTLH